MVSLPFIPIRIWHRLLIGLFPRCRTITSLARTCQLAVDSYEIGQPELNDGWAEEPVVDK